MTGLEPFACVTSDVPVDHAYVYLLGNNAISYFIAFGVPQFSGFITDILHMGIKIKRGGELLLPAP